jgi:hypothetical protein
MDWIPVEFAEIGAHFLENSLIDLGGGIIVNVDYLHPRPPQP